MTSVLIAFSDTGGGHRAAATTLRDELAQARPDAAVHLVDPFAHSTRWPFHRLAAAYPAVVERAPWLWHAGFRLTDTRARAACIQRLAWPAMRSTFERLADEYAPDVIVCTHPLLTTPLRRAFPDTPIVVIVTDLVSGHASWYDERADLIIVPTIASRDAAFRSGLSPDVVKVIGLPVPARFNAIPGERPTLIEALGWSTRRPTILVAGGADGVGPIEALCIAIDRAHLPCDIAAIAGRNTRLAARLHARTWHGTVHIHEFVSGFADMLRAASVFVTKAGPGAIGEACASGCPLVLSGAIPGQETGNVDFVTRGRAGIWAPSPIAVIAALQAWLIGRDAPAALQRASVAARRLAQPDATSRIVANILAVADERAAAANASRRSAIATRIAAA